MLESLTMKLCSAWDEEMVQKWAWWQVWQQRSVECRWHQVCSGDDGTRRVNNWNLAFSVWCTYSSIISWCNWLVIICCKDWVNIHEIGEIVGKSRWCHREGGQCVGQGELWSCRDWSSSKCRGDYVLHGRRIYGRIPSQRIISLLNLTITATFSVLSILFNSNRRLCIVGWKAHWLQAMLLPIIMDIFSWYSNPFILKGIILFQS